MAQQSKKWVFTELVKDPNNIEQLISYAIYKGFKDEIARNARAAGKTEPEIETELMAYHDQCLQSPKQLEVFRKSAKDTLDGYITRVNGELESRLNTIFAQQEADYQKQIKALEKDKKAAEKTALKQLLAGAEKYSKQVTKPVGAVEHIQKYGKAFLKFMFSGVPKLFATAFSVSLMFAIYGWASGDGTSAVRTGLMKWIDMTFPAKEGKNAPSEATNNAPRNGAGPTD
ncbi:hypothetical protein ACM917_003961 [Cronobacter sakazakii]|uniref:hypothetical protein n=1 Tax=Cronobacter TaxID=413496 RepID=UPI0009753D22|nr:MULTISPECIES: hypothetical protein [Cronobacter]EGT4354616.1 hypothetical protein [Cronobacter sakazakii]EJH8728480.1 hypothetical protein [Cronobacter sakazakii]EJJ0567184.1 hypothetical protein [Cronobacter sakazakii]EJK9924414.1 hypothetical protein [Cronobacter sakazakii]EKK4741414.1 hypothetical protein [Cronobacter sakazakii]